MSTLYIAPGADPAFQILNSLQFEQLHAMDAATLRNVGIHIALGARFQIRKQCSIPCFGFQ